jgi:N-acetylneuraminate synthase/sialic acid synthase
MSLSPAAALRQLTFGDTTIHDGSDCYVIAEIGQNHMGSVEVCKDLYLAAKQCGCDAVKIQKRSNKTLFTKAMYDQPYDSEHAFGDTYGSHREALEFDWEQYVDLKAYAQELGIHMFATAWDFDSVDFLAKLDVPAFKVASADLVSIPLLTYMAQVGKPIIISTGGATMEDVRRAMDALLPINTQIAILQCTAAYPVEPEHMHLNVITTLRTEFPETVVGLSDHQNGIAMSILAYALGARVFEKHFTKNRAWKGGDQAFSLEPDGMRRMVRDLRRARQALGSPVKQPYDMEVKPLTKMRKSIVAARDLAAGTVLSEPDLAYRSPGGGMKPFENTLLLGKTLAVDVAADQPLQPSHVS